MSVPRQWLWLEGEDGINKGLIDVNAIVCIRRMYVSGRCSTCVMIYLAGGAVVETRMDYELLRDLLLQSGRMP